MDEIHFASKSREIMTEVMNHLIAAGVSVSCMESCTGGLFASAITDTEGASSVFKGSFVTYSNEAKISCGVPKGVIEKYGVYSVETAEAMAQACREYFHADIGVGITGTTGNPDPANTDGVPGEVYISVRSADSITAGQIIIDTSGLARRDIKERIVLETSAALAEFLNL